MMICPLCKKQEGLLAELREKNIALAQENARLREALKKPCDCDHGLHDSMMLGRDLACHQAKALSNPHPSTERAALVERVVEAAKGLGTHDKQCDHTYRSNLRCDCPAGVDKVEAAMEALAAHDAKAKEE